MLSFAVVAIVAYLVFQYISRVPASQTVDVAQAERRMAEIKGLQIIDVRSSMEHASGAIRGARLIPLQELSSRVSEIDKNRPALIYCRSGHRSGMAMHVLSRQGFSQAVHLKGGILAWQAAGKPLA